MRLCIATPNKFSYSETFIRNHIENLKPELYINNGWAPITISNGKNLFKGLMGVNLIRVAVKNLIPGLYQNLYTKAFSVFLTENKIDTVLAEYGPMGVSVMEACMKVHCRLVVHYHGFDAFDKKTLITYKEKYKALFQYAHRIVAVSIDMRNQLIKLDAPETKVFINSYGVNTKQFKGADQLPLKPVVIAVGRFTAKKSPQNTISAFARVLKKVMDAKLIMIGDGELFEDAKKLAGHLNVSGSVDFKGVLPPDQIVEELRKAKVFVQHSVVAPNGDSEGLPNSILEAASIGLPVVSTFHAGIPEAVKDKVTGFLVKEHDVEGMADHIIDLLNNDELAITMSKAARKHIEDNYSLENQILSLRNILTSN